MRLNKLVFAISLSMALFTFQAQAVECSAVITQIRSGVVIDQRLIFHISPGGVDDELNLAPTSIVKALSGPCNFTFYNETQLQGKFVTLGTNLSRPILIGANAVLDRILAPGPGTWAARSLRVKANVDTNCTIRIGDAGATMDYYGSADSIPLMGHVRNTFKSGSADCTFQLFEGVGRDLRRKNIFLGQNLTHSISVGPDGIYGRGTDLFKASSMTVQQVHSDKKCIAKVGSPRAVTTSAETKPITMEYPLGHFRSVPKFNLVYEVSGYDCAARFYQKEDLNAGFPTALQQLVRYFQDDFGRSVILRGFDARSMAVFPR